MIRRAVNVSPVFSWERGQVDETDAADEDASCTRSGDRCGGEPGDTCGQQTLEEARASPPPRSAYPPTPGFQRGTWVSTVPSHPVWGSWCQPGSVCRERATATRLPANSRPGSARGAQDTRQHVPVDRTATAHSRGVRDASGPRESSRDRSRQTSPPRGSPRPGTRGQTLTGSRGLPKSSALPGSEGHVSSASTPAPSFPPGPHLSVGNKRKEFLKFLKRGGTISIF